MRVKDITSINRRYDPKKNQSYGIITFGSDNAYPQYIKRLVSNSVTGSSCLKTYKSFIKGQGFVNQEEVNDQDLNKLLPLIADDLATYGGFALVVNYNLNYEVSSLYHIPFEHIRLAYNGEGVKIHPDWAKENTDLKQFDARDIVNLPFYNPDKEVIQKQIEEAGGLEGYKGQCYYYSNKGEHCYPLPIFDAALVDMSTEEAIADITHRNAKNGFFPAGCFVDVSNDSDSNSDAVNLAIKKMQGSANASKILYAQVANENEVPKFIPFEGNNYDKDFTVSRQAAEENIIKSFNTPQVLASKNVGTSFGSSLISESYRYYNALTKVERLAITRAITELYPSYDWSIVELRYEEETIEKQPILDVLLNTTINDEMKHRILVNLYKLPVEEANALLGIKEEE